MERFHPSPAADTVIFSREDQFIQISGRIRIIHCSTSKHIPYSVCSGGEKDEGKFRPFIIKERAA